MRKSARLLAPVAALGLVSLLPGVALADSGGTSYQATLKPLNNVSGSGTALCGWTAIRPR